jgi:hypothetical protein
MPEWNTRAIPIGEKTFSAFEVYSDDNGWQSHRYKCLAPSTAQWLQDTLNAAAARALSGERPRNEPEYEYYYIGDNFFGAPMFDRVPKEPAEPVSGEPRDCAACQGGLILEGNTFIRFCNCVAGQRARDEALAPERWVTHHVTDPDWHPGGGHWHPHRAARATPDTEASK